VAHVVQLVSAIDAAPTTRLDLNSGEWRLLYAGTTIGMPPLDRAVVDTLLTDGATYPASAYGNRTLTLRFELETATVDEQANEIQKLARELNRPSNILKWQPDTSTHPVFFRTFRSDISRVDDVPGSILTKYIVVELKAEPFAYGLRETVTPITVSNNPAAASNGCFFDVTGVKGDVETPLILKVPTTNRGDQSAIAVRRRGTPSSAPGFLQAESMTLGTDTTVTASESTMSGSGNNYARCSFSTTTDWSVRISAGSPWPASASVDNRGTYRVFLRCRKTTAADDAEVRLAIGASNSFIINDAVVLPDTTNVVMVDLGLMSIPIGSDPVHDGYSNTEIAARGLYVAVQARRTGGATSVDFDYLAFMPADDRLGVVQWTDNAGDADRLILDGIHELTYGIINSSGALVSMTPGSLAGGFPLLSPGETNRIYHLNEVKPGTGEPTFPTTWSFEPFYYPRYLSVRPAST
jgi:hypothetical protein